MTRTSPVLATACGFLAADLNAGASLSSSSSSLQNGANGALRDEVKRLSQRVDVLTSEKAVLTEQQAQLLGEAETQTMPTNLERESARTTMPTNLERESARTTLVQKASPRRRSSTATTFAWGRNTHGQLGVDGGGEAAVSSIDNLPTAKAIACSHFHTLALDMSGNVYSWGRGALGLLGQGCELDLAAPRRIDELKAIVAVGAGPYQSAAVDAGGSVLVWGWALDADGVAETYHMRPVPQRGLPPTAQIVGVACGAYAAAAWDSAGVLYTWGRGGSGQLGHGAFADEPTPRAVAALSSVRAAAACFGGMEMAETHTGFLLVRTAKGALYSCGCSERGALGRPPLPGGDTGATPAPVDFPSELTVVVAMAAADNHAAAVAQDGSLYTWGNADFGKLGVARTGVVRTPTRAGSAGGLAALTEGLAATGVACSAYSTVALYSDGSLWSFGGAPASVADVAAAAQQKDGPTWRRALAAVKAQLARPVPLAEGLVARAVFGGGYHHVALGGTPDAGMPRFEKEHLEELPAALRGAVGAELAGMLLDDCRGSAPTQLRHELRLLRQFLAAEADKLAALKELRRKAPSGDAWTEGQVTVQRVHEWTDTREHLNEWAVEGAAVA